MATGSGDRSEWLRKVGSVGLGVFFALFVAMLVTNWVVIDVRTFDHDGVRVRVPVPLNVLRIPLHMAPRASVCVPMTRASERQHALVLAALRTLQDAPAGTVVPVSVEDNDLELSRSGDRLLIVVGDESCSGQVHASLPFAATMRLLERSASGRLEPRALLDLLAATERGELLTVDAEDARVRVTTW
jgi:hypothetical protein